ncbi:MAG: cytochrome b N-terminal domain-containing protein [Anaerolineales bacterium]
MEAQPTRTLKERLLYTSARSDDASRMRAVVNSAILHLHPVAVPRAALRFSYTWGLGGISVFLGLLLGITGVLLMFRYDASIERAYLSIQELEATVIFGSLIRGIHHWSANLLVVTTFLHLLRVFYTGGYKKGRWVNWFVGIALLLIVLAFNLTGYLLPWDQLAYWASTVSTGLLGYIPFVGRALSKFIIGGAVIGQGTIRNFYAVHVAALPIIMAATLSYHFWKIRKNGGISQPEQIEHQQAEKATSIPHLVQREFAAAAIILTAVMIWAMFRPAPLQSLADPSVSPNPAKAAWYFLGFQELLLHMHPSATIGLVGLVLSFIFLIPILDPSNEDIGIYFRSKKGKWIALLSAFLAVDLVVALVAVDEYWLDLSTSLPNLPITISFGLIPLSIALLILGLIYVLNRMVFKASHSEALVGIFTFVMISLITLTIIGIFFRGANMVLALPG